MNTPLRHRARLSLGLALTLIAATTLSGCKAWRQARAERRAKAEEAKAAAAPAAKPSKGMTLDGKFDDWPAGVSTLADSDWVYFRVAVEGSGKPIQAMDSTLALWIDADDNPGTGSVMASPKVAAAMGVDLVVEFSPQNGQGKATPGVAAYAMDKAGAKTPLTREQLDLTSAPTTAAPIYEIRISRHADAVPALAKLLNATGKARGMFVLIEGGKVVGWSDPEAFNMPALGKGGARSDADPPSKPSGAIRILSYNVQKNSPEKNQNPFARIFQVTKPDIILLQEWDTNVATAQAWFTAVVSGDVRWNARVSPAGDVLIVSPYPVNTLVSEAVTAQGADKPVRFVSGVVKTPAGSVAVGTVHLKCCGTVGSTEDQKRIAEAVAVQAAMNSALGTDGSILRVIAGDMNLVGSTTPLDKLSAGLDFDGSPLAAVEPLVLGDTAEYTWTDVASEFPPGRLDYMLYSDSKATVVNAFVLDTRKLSARSLGRMGVDKTDSAASDHLPLVVDIRPR